MTTDEATVARFWSKVDKSGSCWLWTGGLSTNGYGVFCLPRAGGPSKRVAAHRYAYELLVGPVPDGLELDHVRDRGCANRHCVKPAHLEPVTHRENMQRSPVQGIGLPTARAVRSARARARTHCKYGHPITPENTYSYAYGRFCRPCQIARSAAAYRRKALS